MAELGVTRVFNADQTAVLYEYLPKKTLSRRGDKTIWVRGGNKEKERLTAMLLGNSDGDKYPPMLVYKCSKSTVPETALVNIRDRHGFGIGIWKQIEPLQIETAMPIYGNTKGWFNNELVMKFLEHYFAERTDSGTPVLLLLDDFTGHWTAEVAAYAKRLNVVLERVPPGCTSVCQPADIAWMKPLKDRLRRKWVSSIRDQLRARVPGQPFKMKAPDRIVMARWIKAVWDDMPPSTIRNGFRKADFIDREEASRGELQAPEEVDKDDDVVALLEESGLLDLDVGVIDSDDDFDL